jgi:hypothetical protein
MKTLSMVALALFVLTAPAWAQRWDNEVPRFRVPIIGGPYYLNGDPNARCEVIQRRPDGNAEFINENGSRVAAVIRGNQVWIPEWKDRNGYGLVGLIQRDRIRWPDGSFWSR